MAQTPLWVEGSWISLRILSGRKALGNCYLHIQKGIKISLYFTIVFWILIIVNLKMKIFQLGNTWRLLKVCSFVLGGNEIAASASVLDSGISKVSAFLYWQRKCVTLFLKALRLDQGILHHLFCSSCRCFVARSMCKAFWISLKSSFAYLCCLCYAFTCF